MDIPQIEETMQSTSVKGKKIAKQFDFDGFFINL